MKKHLFRLSALVAALALVSCAQDALDEDVVITPDNVENTTNLTTVTLASFSGNGSRVSYPAATRAEEEEAKPGTLELVAEIANPSKAEGFNLVQGEGRYLSATSVYYNEATETYYATYHMQGNNYNTTLKNEIGGAIQAFQVAADGTVTLLDGFRAASPSKEDYDFNHVYFDNTDQRIIVVGHNWKVPSSWTGDGEYEGKRDNTQAIIGAFDATTGKLTYSSIQTDKKAYDEAGHSLGYTDAGDANCVIRANDGVEYSKGYSGYPQYYVATRKGIAVVSAAEGDLFRPILNADGSNYFVPTPGSVKFVFNNPEVGSGMDFFYLSDDYTPEEGDITAATSSEARIASFQVATGTNDVLLGLINPSAPYTTYYDSKELDILNYEQQQILPEVVKPVDGKNAMYALSFSEYYAAMGTTGLYYKFKGNNTSKDYIGVKKFGNRPVNCVVADRCEQESGHDGFLYVANGAKLTILHRKTMEEVASWNVPTKDANGNDIDVAASANYITVTKAPVNEDGSARDRYITVAFGQEGVKVFKFCPSTLEPKTVWERDIE